MKFSFYVIPLQRYFFLFFSAHILCVVTAKEHRLYKLSTGQGNFTNIQTGKQGNSILVFTDFIPNNFDVFFEVFKNMHDTDLHILFKPFLNRIISVGDKPKVDVLILL